MATATWRTASSEGSSGSRWGSTSIRSFLAFGTALLAGGTHRGERVLSRPSVTPMTSDQPTPEYFDAIGWGFGMSVRTRRTHRARR